MSEASRPTALLRALRQAQRELTLAQVARRRARQALARAEERVRAARRQVRLIEQALRPLPAEVELPICEQCRHVLGTTPACHECSAYRVLGGAG